MSKQFAIAALVVAWVISTPIHRCIALQNDEFEKAPISYSKSTPLDRVSRLWDKIRQGSAELVPNAKGDYLETLLQALEIPTESQCLVFSKTSLQISKIGPRTPRAIYFNDDTYVGYIPSSKVIEITAIDPTLGAIFYTLEPDDRADGDAAADTARPDYRIARDRGQCLSCHATTRTERVPGVLVRSIYSDRAGRPRTGSSTFHTDHRSPFSERWGGWYVTGNHGQMRHMGNVLAVERDDPEGIDPEQGANWTSLKSAFNVSPYLHDSSDIVALMVLEHQTRIHNLITRANFETRQALFLDETMNRALERPEDYRSDSTTRRIRSVGNELVKGLLLANEFPLTSPVAGTIDYESAFERLDKDVTPESTLRTLDLKTRLFKYACSFLIHSDHFESLPQPVREYVVQEIKEILTGIKPAPEGVLWSSEIGLETWRRLEPTFAHLNFDSPQN